MDQEFNGLKCGKLPDHKETNFSKCWLECYYKLGGYVASWNVLTSYWFAMWYKCYFSTVLNDEFRTQNTNNKWHCCWRLRRPFVTVAQYLYSKHCVTYLLLAVSPTINDWIKQYLRKLNVKQHILCYFYKIYAILSLYCPELLFTYFKTSILLED